jgi:hypothetical protein
MSEMDMRLRRLPVILAVFLSLSAAAAPTQNTDQTCAGHPGGGGHFADGHDGWSAHPGWQGNIQHFNASHWEGGHWWHGLYQGREGWWWIVGPDWYWFPAEVYPYPNPYTPPDMAEGYWYWCDAYQQYYPFVGACPSGWRAVKSD